MSRICDTCRNEHCRTVVGNITSCDFYVGGETRYEKLFGTPERAARTLADISERVNLGGIGGDCDALLGWLRGGAE